MAFTHAQRGVMSEFWGELLNISEESPVRLMTAIAVGLFRKLTFSDFNRAAALGGRGIAVCRENRPMSENSLFNMVHGVKLLMTQTRNRQDLTVEQRVKSMVTYVAYVFQFYNLPRMDTVLIRDNSEALQWALMAQGVIEDRMRAEITAFIVGRAAERAREEEAGGDDNNSDNEEGGGEVRIFGVDAHGVLHEIPVPAATEAREDEGPTEEQARILLQALAHQHAVPKAAPAPTPAPTAAPSFVPFVGEGQRLLPTATAPVETPAVQVEIPAALTNEQIFLKNIKKVLGHATWDKKDQLVRILLSAAHAGNFDVSIGKVSDISPEALEAFMSYNNMNNGYDDEPGLVFPNLMEFLQRVSKNLKYTDTEKVFMIMFAAKHFTRVLKFQMPGAVANDSEYKQIVTDLRAHLEPIEIGRESDRSLPSSFFDLMSAELGV